MSGCQPKTFLTFFFDGETFLTFLFFWKTFLTFFLTVKPFQTLFFWKTFLRDLQHFKSEIGNEKSFFFFKAKTFFSLENLKLLIQKTLFLMIKLFF